MQIPTEENGLPQKETQLTVRLLNCIGNTAKDAALTVHNFVMSIIRI